MDIDDCLAPWLWLILALSRVLMLTDPTPTFTLGPTFTLNSCV